LVAAFKATCFKNVDALLKATNDFPDSDQKNKLKDGIDMYLDILKSQEAVFMTMAECKETTKTNDMTAKAVAARDKLFKMGGPKAKEYKPHMIVLEDSTE